MLESYDSKALYAILSKIVVVIVVKVEEGMHDMHRMITNPCAPHAHWTSHVFIVCIHVYMRQFTKECFIKNDMGYVYTHTFFLFTSSG